MTYYDKCGLESKIEEQKMELVVKQEQIDKLEKKNKELQKKIDNIKITASDFYYSRFSNFNYDLQNLLSDIIG